MAIHSVDSIYFTNQHSDTTDAELFYAMQTELKPMAYDTAIVSNADSTFKYANKYRSDTVPLGILDFDFYRIKDAALNTGIYFNFDTINDVLSDLVVRPGYPYDQYNTCILSPLVDEILNATVVYRFDPAFLFADQKNEPCYRSPNSSLRIDFDDGAGWQIISTTSINFYTANYAGGNGNPVLKWELLCEAGSVNGNKFGSATMKTGRNNLTEADSTIDFPGLTIGLYPACESISNAADKKVFIYLEGFDPLDQIASMDRGVPEIYEERIKGSGLDDLRRFGHDIFVVNWKNSSLDIKTNARYIIDMLNWLKCNHPSNQPYVVMGESMGGLVARYALLMMERATEGKPCYREKMHNVRLLITNDTPNNGANIPMSVQFMYKDAPGILGNILGTAAKAILVSEGLGLDGDSPKQMLMYHVSQCSATSAAQNIAPDPQRTQFKNDLATLGNYPKYCKTLAMSDGSMAGLNQTTDYSGVARIANDDLINLQNSSYFKWKNKKIKVSTASIILKTGPNGTALVYDYTLTHWGIKFKLKLFGIKISTLLLSNITSNTRSINSAGLDVKAGGVMSGLKTGIASKTMADGLQSIFGKLTSKHNSLTHLGNGSYAVHGNYGKKDWFGADAVITSQGLHWNFVPTISALDYNSSNYSHDVQADGFAIPNNNPFSALMGVYTGCTEAGVALDPFMPLLQFTHNRLHCQIRNDQLTNDGSVTTVLSKAIFYKDSCKAKQVQFLNREIGDDELYLNNYTLNYFTHFLPEKTLLVKQSPYLNYAGQTDIRKRVGIYTKTAPMQIAGGGYAVFNYNSLNGIFHPGSLNGSQYLVNNYAWDICCNSVARKGIFEEQGPIAGKNRVDYFVYPNPNDGNDNLYIIVPDDKPRDISITDALSKVYYQQTVQPVNRIITVLHHALPLSPGIYFVNVSRDYKTVIKKLIISD